MKGNGRILLLEVFYVLSIASRRVRLMQAVPAKALLSWARMSDFFKRGPPWQSPTNELKNN